MRSRFSIGPVLANDPTSRKTFFKKVTVFRAVQLAKQYIGTFDDAMVNDVIPVQPWNKPWQFVRSALISRLGIPEHPTKTYCPSFQLAGIVDVFRFEQYMKALSPIFKSFCGIS